jgi:hypothetical protein
MTTQHKKPVFIDFGAEESVLQALALSLQKQWWGKETPIAEAMLGVSDYQFR